MAGLPPILQWLFLAGLSLHAAQDAPCVCMIQQGKRKWRVMHKHTCQPRLLPLGLWVWSAASIWFSFGLLTTFAWGAPVDMLPVVKHPV
jgi:hypothetical protein